MSYGAQIKFGIARQTSTGSGSAVSAVNSFHHIPLISEDVGLEKEEVQSENLTGRFEQGATYDGPARIAGTLECEPSPKSLGLLLTAACGQTTATASGTLRNYTFLPRSQDYSAIYINEPLTVYKQFSDASSAEYYFDCQVGQVEFQYSQGALLRARASVVGGRRVATGIGSLGFPLETTDLSMGWLWDVASISYGGTGVSVFSDITVTLNDNIEPLYTMDGSLLPYKYTRTGFREVTVNGTLYYVNRDQLNDFSNGTQRRLVITGRNTRYAIQSGFYPTFVIDVPQMKITTMKPGATGPGEVAVSFTARGVLDPTSNYTVQFLLTNTYTAGY